MITIEAVKWKSERDTLKKIMEGLWGDIYLYQIGDSPHEEVDDLLSTLIDDIRTVLKEAT